MSGAKESIEVDQVPVYAHQKATCYCPAGAECDPSFCVKKYWFPGSPVVESSSSVDWPVSATPSPFNYLPEECPAEQEAVQSALEAGAPAQPQERAPDPLFGMPLLKLERAAGGVSPYIPSAEKDERLIQLEARLLGASLAEIEKVRRRHELLFHSDRLCVIDFLRRQGSAVPMPKSGSATKTPSPKKMPPPSPSQKKRKKAPNAPRKAKRAKTVTPPLPSS